MENIQNYKDALASVSKKEMEQRKTIKRLLQEKEELKKQLALYGVKDKVKFTLENWLFSNGIRYVSGHNYKSNDGDIYDSDEIEKMYEHYLSL